MVGEYVTRQLYLYTLPAQQRVGYFRASFNYVVLIKSAGTADPVVKKLEEMVKLVNSPGKHQLIEGRLDTRIENTRTLLLEKGLRPELYECIRSTPAKDMLDAFAEDIYDHFIVR